MFRAVLGLLMAVVAVAALSAPATARTSFTIVHTARKYTPRGQELPIRASIQPKSELQHATLFYRRAGNTSYSSKFFTEEQGNEFIAVIPAEEVTSHGIEYYISAIDKSGYEQVLFASQSDPEYVSTKIVSVLLSRRSDKQDQVLKGIRGELQARVDEYQMNGSMDQGKVILQQIKAQEIKPDLVIAIGREAALLCRDEVDRIPVVFTMVTDPYQDGLKTGNMTGVTADVPVKEQLRTFKNVIPDIRKVGVIYDPSKTGSIISQAQLIAPSQGFQLVSAKVDDPKDVPRTLRAFSDGIDAFWLVPDSTVVTQFSWNTIKEFADARRIPLFVFDKAFVIQGALVSLSPDLEDMGRKTADMAQRILREGKSPGQLPIASPEKLTVALNSDTAVRLGVEDISTRVVLYAGKMGYPIVTVNR